MEVALYYPYLAPPFQWMKQSLLFFDAVSSIVPIRYEDGSDLPDLLRSPENIATLQWLYGEGHWIPVTSHQVGDERDYADDLLAALQAISEAKTRSANLVRLTPAMMFRDKVGMMFERQMLATGLATEKGQHLEVPAYAMWIILSILATHLAKPESRAFRRSDRATINTDSTKYFNFVTGPFESSSGMGEEEPVFRRFDSFKEQQMGGERSECYEVLLDGLLPVPGPNVSLPDIIAFRDSYRDELLAFRIAVNEMLRDALQSPEPMQTIMDHRARIELALVWVHRAARSRRIQLGAAAAAIATGFAATGFIGGGDAIKWVFDGIGAAVTIALTGRALRYPRKESPGPDMSYLIKSYSLT